MSAEYLREQAATCRYLARQCFDLSVTERLRIMADDFITKAEAIERSKLASVPAMILANGSAAAVS
jgi:hypothetical protein